jgi:hypothetical protein
VLPEPIYRAPLFPLVEAPELKTMRPLVPVVPASAESMYIGPLDVAAPAPLLIDTWPPVFDADFPAVRAILPPTLVAPELSPTAKSMLPPCAPVDEPELIEMEPLFADAAGPLPMTTAPEPLLEVPVPM